MQCEHCGGCVPPGFVGEQRRCDFCEAFRCQKLLRNASARIKILCKTTGIACPGCDQDLRFGKLSKMKVLHCAGCDGLLMTRGALRETIRRRRSQDTQPGLAPQAVVGTPFQRSAICPQCTRTLELHPYHGPGQALIEACDHCDLVWFEPAETRAGRPGAVVSLPQTLETAVHTGG